jgi:hypothetical protein
MTVAVLGAVTRFQASRAGDAEDADEMAAAAAVSPPPPTPEASGDYPEPEARRG